MPLGFSYFFIMRIGIFDSGFGGLTIYKALADRLPEYDYVYLGDNARTPYGNRSFDTIYEFTREGVDFLFGRDCKLIIIACNTASAKALRGIQQNVLPGRYPGRNVLGIIRPSVEELTRQSKTRVAALWATEGTVQSESFVLELAKSAPHIHLLQWACPMLVPLVEAGELSGGGTDFFIHQYWNQTHALHPEIDTLLLACTHYPLLYPRIRAIVPPEVSILMQGDFVAPSLADYLTRHPEINSALTRGGTRSFLTTDRTEGFDRLAEAFIGHSVISEKISL